MYSERIEKSITSFSSLYGIAEEAYKRLQTLLQHIDDKIHNEFRYCSRGLKEFILGLHTDSEDESIERLQKATHAVKNAFNDTVDLIVGYAASKISEFSHIDTGKELILYVPNLNKILESIHKIHGEIAESRADIGNRVEAYKRILDSEEFKIIIQFCESSHIIENNLATDYSRAVKSRRNFIITTSLSVAAIVIGLVGAIEKLPEFILYLSKFYPSLSKFL